MCCMYTLGAEEACVWVYPPGSRAAVENCGDISVNFLSLSCLFFFLDVLFFSPDLLHVLTWLWKVGKGVLTLFSFQKEKKLAGVHISVLELCRLKSPSGKMEDMRDQIAGGDTY